MYKIKSNEIKPLKKQYHCIRYDEIIIDNITSIYCSFNDCKRCIFRKIIEPNI